jgi:putative SOS response-associated peptidase YedK
MCGRFVATTPAADLARLFSVTAFEIERDEPSWNVAPTDPVRTIVHRHDGRVLETRRWGLVPHWTHNAPPQINARAETVHVRPMFRDAFVRKRCIVPADGFYEWRHGRPHYIRPVDGQPLAFAGLRATRGDGLRTCAIITTTANETMRALHDRMPVVLPRDAWNGWLDPAERDVEWLRSLLVPATPGCLEVLEVGRAVNSVRNDGPHLLEPAPVQGSLFG